MRYKLDAGVARTDINPTIGMRLCGSLRDENSTDLHDDLYISALYLTSGGKSIVVISADCIIFSLEESNRIRDEVANAVSLNRDEILLNLSHTHAVPGPPSFNEFDKDREPEQHKLNLDYFESVVASAVHVGVEAKSKTRSATLAALTGNARIGINRREELPDGTLVLGENPLGAYDDTVGVVRIDEISGAPIACIVHASCHPDILGPKSTLVSPDFIGPMRHVLERETGAMAFFLQGCCADIDPITGIVNGADAVNETERLGALLGAESLKVYHSIGPSRIRKERIAWRSQNSVVTGWLYGESELQDAVLKSVTTTVRLPFRDLPEVHECQDFRDTAAREVESAMSGMSLLSDQLVARRRYIWSEIQLSAAKQGTANRSLDLPLYALRIGPVIFVGIPAEVFTEIGSQIRENLGTTDSVVLVSGYTNGVYFYIPTARAFQYGGYEVNSHRNYLKPSGPTAEWEEQVVAASVDLAKQMDATPAP